MPGKLEQLRVLRGSPLQGLAHEHFESPIVSISSLLGPVLVVSSPTALRHILVANAENYPRDPLQRRMWSDGLGFGLLTAEGERWRNQRRIVAPHFAPQRVAAMESAMADSAGSLVRRWSARGDGGSVDLSEIQALAMDVIDATLFPEGVSEKEKVPAALKDYFRKAGRVSVLDVLNLPAVPRIAALRTRRSIATLRQAADRTIARWRSRTPGPSRGAAVLDRMAAGAEVTGNPLEPVEVRDIVTTFLTAGSETSAGAMIWALYLLSIDAEWRERVEAEADREMPEGSYVAGSLSRFVATRAVAEETLRLYPPVPATARRAIGADTLDSLAVTAGTRIIVSPWVIHRHRRLWPDPDLFDPSRFMPGAREKIDRFAYLPFGAGGRICIGQGFAIQEMVIVVASILRHFRLEPTLDFSIWPDQRVTLQPKGKLEMVLRSKSQQQGQIS